MIIKGKKYEYETGRIYGILKVLDLYHDEEKNRIIAISECTKCGKIKHMRADELYNENNISCTCMNKKYDHFDKGMYGIYSNMKYRCNLNATYESNKNYALKGISVCDEWSGEDGFLNFYNWSMEHGYAENLTIDRIDSKGNYCPENCQWITLSENVAKANREHVRRKSVNGTYYGISPDGEYYEFENANQFAREHTELVANNIRQVATGTKNIHKGWKFGFVKDIEK